MTDELATDELDLNYEAGELLVVDAQALAKAVVRRCNSTKGADNWTKNDAPQGRYSFVRVLAADVVVEVATTQVRDVSKGSRTQRTRSTPTPTQ